MMPENHGTQGLLRVADLTKSFDGVQALCGVELNVPKGRIVGLIGPNGAGKTTLFNVVCGFLLADSGEVSLDGKVLKGLPPHQVARLGISRTFQDLRLLRRISVLDNVLLSFQSQLGEGLMHAIGARWRAQELRNVEKAKEVLAFVGLADKAQAMAQELSYGQQKLLTLACCLATAAPLLLLDEPVAGIQPDTVQRILSLLRKLRSEGKAILLIEHNLEAVRSIADEVVVLSEGRKIAEGSPETVMQDPNVLEAYLV